MRRINSSNSLLAAMLCLHALAYPVRWDCAWLSLTAAAALAAPLLIVGLLLQANDRAKWACISGGCAAAQLHLPLIAFLRPESPNAIFFGMTYWAISRFCAGWLLRSAGASKEKNFTLILAYRQTLRHIGSFPNESDPTYSPLFQPARNALSALHGLIPFAGWIIGILANSVCFNLITNNLADHIIVFAIRLLAVGSALTYVLTHRSGFLPKKRPDQMTVIAIAARFVVLPAIFLCFSHAVSSSFPANVVLLLLALPPCHSLRNEMHRQELLSECENQMRWLRIVWLVWLPLFILFH